WLVAASAAALRVLLIFRYRFDSDEPQHMHVAWGWAHGLVQHRDLFDNHMPLFHIVTSPLFRFSEDPRLLFAARLLMLPLFAITLMLVWEIASRLEFDPLTSTLLAALVPPFYLGTLEYRTDDLWVVFWLAMILALLSSAPRLRRAAWAGIFLGLAFAVALKSILFLCAVGAATAITLLLTRTAAPRLSSIAVFLGSACTPPLLIAGLYALSGSWKPFFYDVVGHNIVPAEHTWRMFWFIAGYPVARFVVTRIARSDGDPSLVRRRVFIAAAALSYFLVLISFWPILNLETFLPFYPLLALGAAGLLTSWRPERRAVAILCAAAQVVVIVVVASPWKDRAEEEIALVEEVLSLTRIEDPVMDLKGECVFRHRSYPLVIESLTNHRLRLGMLRDEIAGVLAQT